MTIRAAPGLWLAIVLTAAVVLPPVGFLVQLSLSGAGGVSLANFARVATLSGWEVWRTTALFAVASALLAVALGFSSAWLVLRTDVPLRQAAFAGAFLSLATPPVIKGIGWILLLGPNNGVLTVWWRSLFGQGAPVFALFSLSGMVLVEGLLLAPIAFLLAYPPLAAIDPALDEAASACGASRLETLRRVTLPMMRPALLTVLLLATIGSLETFDVPLLIGIPAHLQTVTTAIYESMNSGFTPDYGQASAYALMLVALIVLPLILYYRATAEQARFVTVTGKGFRPSRLALGVWRLPCALWTLLIPAALCAPLAMMAWSSLSADYARVLTRSDLAAALWNSLLVGAASATLVAAAALVCAWLVTRGNEPVRWVLDVLASFPIVLPGIVLGIALLAESLRLSFVPIYGTPLIFVAAFGIKYMPLGMRFSHTGLLAVHRDLEESAFAHGARPLTTLRRIVLPLTAPAVVSSWLYVFMHSIRDLSTPILLAGPANTLAAVVILDLWNNGNIPDLAAVSVVVAAAAALTGGLFMRLTLRRNLYA